MPAAMSFFIIFTGISRAKFKFIREPLVFSDIALVADVFKYKTIFYATSLNIVFWIVAFAYVFGVSGMYMYFEPSVLPARDKPFWMGADPLAEGRIESVRVVDPDREPLFLKNRPAITVPGPFPGEPAVFAPERPLPGARRIRHLVVLDGGREE